MFEIISDTLQLLTLDTSKGPVVFDNKKDLAGHFADLPDGRVHNVLSNEELQYGVAVGARPRESECGAGLIFFDLKDPSKPTKLGCNAQDGYVHDVSNIFKCDKSRTDTHRLNA